ncbi:hypothetical protein EV681_2881 [Advenella incenata]|uniref:Uncharacterized protein n=1 Tax=Advenella incenata TaxID=267800 RepID=A0A4Q7VC69_9BURK|nr:hypothetical protein EV681_2881 [Advenella incenata]
MSRLLRSAVSFGLVSLLSLLGYALDLFDNNIFCSIIEH